MARVVAQHGDASGGLTIEVGLLPLGVNLGLDTNGGLATAHEVIHDDVVEVTDRPADGRVVLDDATLALLTDKDREIVGRGSHGTNNHRPRVTRSGNTLQVREVGQQLRHRCQSLLRDLLEFIRREDLAVVAGANVLEVHERYIRPPIRYVKRVPVILSNMSDTPTTGLLLDGVFASQAIDSSGEILDIKGMDVSDFDEGKGLANYEHQEDERDKEEKAKDEKPHGEEIVGKVIFTKKIFGPDDCANDRERLFWKRTKLPFLYGVVRLYDAAGHDGAKALAASIRDSVANDEPIVIGFSIEGTTMEKKGNVLKSTIGRLVALTKKPCNKQAVSGILADPLAPAGFSKNPENAKTYLKTERSNGLVVLGGSETEYDSAVFADMQKALSAGSYNAAPGALVNGAALQVEDKTLKSMALAAKRDWDKTGKFRDYLKSRLDKADLGDVSDEFLDHYSDIVEANRFRIKKSEEVIAELKKAGKTPKVVAPLPKKKAEDFWLTNNGTPVKPNKKVLQPTFDETKGVLHMPHGSFKVYLPKHDAPEIAGRFHQILNDPKVDEFHGYAMENWAKAHQLLKAGKLPPEVAMHSVLFSNLSPNTPVPMQEHMYGHLVDSMKATGQSPLTSKWEDVKQDWLDRDQPQKFPDHSPEHWKRLEGALRLKNDSKTTGRTKGDIGSFMLANDKFDNMSKYKNMHAKLQDLLQRHKGDARGSAEEMMYHKNEQVKWNNRRRLGLVNGKADIGDYPGMSISGLAPKTSRYALAMMGGGNVHVPDTHFTRNLFGLNRDRDGRTIEAIKNVMWEPRNTHILNGIDRYYAKHHDAVDHMVNHPKWGSLFQNREDAVFPAFWKHWMAIVPHEQARGHTVNGYNELTDHKPFWEAIAPYMKKSETEPSSIPMQTAKQHAEWQLQYGEIPAMMLYYRHLLPQLLGAAAQREGPELVRKAQELGIEVLAKGFTPRTQAKLESLGGPNKNTVTFQNREVKPGKAYMPDDKGNGEFYHLVGHSPTHLFGVKESDEHDIFSQGWDHNDLVKIPRTQKGLSVKRYPETQGDPNVVNADVHGVPGFVNHPETRALAHGFDFGSRQIGKIAGAKPGAFDRTSFWAKDPSGKHVYVKGSSGEMQDENGNEGPWNTARKEGAYHNLAKDYFGLGAHMPAVAVVRHPSTGQEHAIIQHVPGKHEHDMPMNEIGPTLSDMNKSGDVHKLAIMNFLMNNTDRHAGNYLYGDNGKLTMIDHNMFGRSDERRWYSDPRYLRSLENYEHNYGGKPEYQMAHPEAQAWLQKLDPEQFRNHLMTNGAPQQVVDQSLERLGMLKTNIVHHPLSKAFYHSSDTTDYQPGTIHGF